jgi:asparagine synthase (glutamine-hydrolysing)
LFLRSTSGAKQADLESVADAFYEAVQKRSSDIGTSRMGLSLSGGLDSRAILAGLGDKACQIRSYTLGLSGCADQRLAFKMAKIAGTAHAFVPIKKEDLENFEELARLMVFLSDGLYHPHESTERVALNYLATDPFDIMLRGHGGEIAKASLAYPFQASSSMHDCTPEEIVEGLYVAASLGKQDMNWKTVFNDSIADEIIHYGAGSLEAAAQPAVSAGLVPEDICVFLYISQWIPRQVVASLALFRSKVNIRLPYLDRNFLELLLQLPVHDRWNGEFHRFFVKKYAADLARVPDSNTGAPLTAGVTRLWFTDKVNSVLRRVNMPGFRHYTDFQSWQRRYFSGITEEILFDSKSLSRNYYDPKGLRAIFDLHVANKKNYAHFLGTAVAIELWHRIFLENN